MNENFNRMISLLKSKLLLFLVEKAKCKPNFDTNPP